MALIPANNSTLCLSMADLAFYISLFVTLSFQNAAKFLLAIPHFTMARMCRQYARLSIVLYVRDRFELPEAASPENPLQAHGRMALIPVISQNSTSAG
jgi:hypothetical protein